MKTQLDAYSQKLFDASDELMKRRDEALERFAVHEERLNTLIQIAEESIRRARVYQQQTSRPSQSS